MKVRSGFVSNSSTSSFCIIGVYRGWGANATLWVQKLVEAEQVNVENYDWMEKTFKVVGFWGSEEPRWAGMEAEKLLQTMTIPQARQYFHDKVLEAFGIDIPLKDIEFHYDYVSTG